MARGAERSAEGKRFGDVIRRMRKERGLTQERLAERADIATDYLGFIERGENVPTLPVILKIARGLKVPPAELFRDFE